MMESRRGAITLADSQEPGNVRSRGVDPVDVETVVNRIAASATLGRSEQLVRFLRFVVAEALAGRGHLLKEYTIGVEALGRPVKFDPTTDSVVRVQARQLRFKLAEYAAAEGTGDPLRIELPKGSYAPVFIARLASDDSKSIESAALAPEPPAGRSRRTMLTWSAAALLATAAVFSAVVFPRGSTGNARAGDVDTPRSVVVLPFANLTGDPDADYISDGITDELTAAMAKLPHERVVARTSAFQYKKRPADVRAIGRQLGVDHVIEGSVRRAGDTVRITVQLDRATDGVQLWAASFDEPTASLLRAEETVARSVVGAFARTFSPALELTPPRPPTRDAEAYAAYLKGRYYFNRRDPASMKRAIALFSDAITRDSSFALAYSGLAAVHATMAINSQSPPGVGPPLAELAARTALLRDSTLGEAHATLGLMRAFAHWDWTEADAEFRRAIALSPNLASAHSWYAVTLIARGKFDSALDQLRDAQRLDPLSMPIAYSIGETMFYARRWSQATAQARTVLELDSTYLGGYNLLWRIDAETGKYDDALDAMRKLRDSSGAPIVLARMGRSAEARRRTAAIPATTAREMPYFVACLYAATGDRDSALTWLERAYHVGQIDIVSMAVDPEMDALRGEPRFKALLEKIGLSDTKGR